ncbi:MAG: hypothetical protein Q4F12_02460 [Erysipelotrichaceae bacterium]|nr:hypothetical protein [Erysipelotrichaceae bacterium]
MQFTIIPPREIKKGLHASYTVDNNDCFCMTALDIRFTVPDKEPKLDKNVFNLMMRLIFNEVKAGEYANSILNYSSIFDTGISLNISGGPGEESLDYVVNIINNIIKDTDENTVYGNISKDICQNAINELKKYYNLLTKEHAYEYEEKEI